MDKQNVDEISIQFEQKLEIHGKDMRIVALSASEKDEVRTRLETFLHAHPPMIAKNPIKRSFGAKIRMVVSVILAIVLGSGVSYAAEGSLPGDKLYPIKIRVNEEVRIWVAVSDEAKAQLQAKLAEERLKEAEKLATEGRLDTETQTQIAFRFEEHAKESESYTKKVESGNRIAVSADIQSDFEAVLEAHEKVLVELESKNEGTKAQIGVVLDGVRVRINSTSDMRAETEARVFAGTGDEIKLSAEDAKKSAEKTLVEMRKVRKNRKHTRMVATTSIDIQATDAEKAFEDAREKLDAGASADAFSLFMKANRRAQSAKLLTNASDEFDIDINGEEEHILGGDDKEIRIDGGTVKIKKGKVEVNVATSTKNKDSNVLINVNKEGEAMHDDSDVEAHVSTSNGGAIVNTTQTIQVNSENVRVGI